MTILILKCANGFVTYRFGTRFGPKGLPVICVNDGLIGYIPKSSGQELDKALALIFSHAVVLKGAVQQVVPIVLPSG